MENAKTKTYEKLALLVPQLQQCNTATQKLIDTLWDITNQLYAVLGSQVVYCILREINGDTEQLHKKITDYLTEMENLVEFYRMDEKTELVSDPSMNISEVS